MTNQASSDPIADMLTRIRNAIAVNKTEINLPHSKMKEAIAELLTVNTFIDGFKVESESAAKRLVLTLNRETSSARITAIAKLSKPGRRTYVQAKEIPTVQQGRGIVILSTSKGLLTGEQAKSQHVGGELICQVY